MGEDHNKKNPIFEALKLDLEKNLEEALKGLLHKNLKKDQTLYHYTNLFGLKAIIESQCFFSSNSTYLNDKKEYYYGLDLFKSCIEDKKNIVKDHKTKLSIIESVQKELENKRISFHYVTCFSLDGDLLSQWRAYADDGKGIAIGLDPKKMKEAFKPKANGMYVEYDLKNQKKIAEKIISVCHDFYALNIKMLEKLNEPDLYTIIAKEINEVIDKYIGLFKHNSFSEEREFRFDLSIDKDYNESSDILSYRVSRNNLLVPYLELKTEYRLEKEHREKNKMGTDDLDKYKIKLLPITEIIIGPSTDFELNKQSIEGFLKKHNYEDVNIISSEVPYRI